MMTDNFELVVLPAELADLFHRICYTQDIPEVKRRLLKKYSELLVKDMTHEDEDFDDEDPDDLETLYRRDLRIDGMQKW
jgi:hypothetical protein